MTFPNDMQPGELVTMQPTDAVHGRQHYIDDDRYWSQPKDDGHKLVVFAHEDGQVWFQTRQKRLIDPPSATVKSAFADAAFRIGSFIVEGEIFYAGRTGKQYMSATTAEQVEGIKPRLQIRLFGCLWSGSLDLTLKEDQVALACGITKILMNLTSEFAWMPVARTRQEKQALADEQSANGREGEVYFLKDLAHRSGKITSRRDPQYDGYVRCKYYLGVQRYMVIDVQKWTGGPFDKVTRQDGTVDFVLNNRAISGFSIEDTDGNAVGNVGTGYSRDQEHEILRRFLGQEELWVLVDAQTKTPYGQLRHAVFKGFWEGE